MTVCPVCSPLLRRVLDACGPVGARPPNTHNTASDLIGSRILLKTAVCVSCAVTPKSSMRCGSWRRSRHPVRIKSRHCQSCQSVPPRPFPLWSSRGAASGLHQLVQMHGTTADPARSASLEVDGATDATFPRISPRIAGLPQLNQTPPRRELRMSFMTKTSVNSIVNVVTDLFFAPMPGGARRGGGRGGARGTGRGRSATAAGHAAGSRSATAARTAGGAGRGTRGGGSRGSRARGRGGGGRGGCGGRRGR